MGQILAWISGQDARNVLLAAGAIAAALTAMLVLLRQPVVFGPIRWLGRTLIADPLTRVIHRALDEWATRVWGPRIDAIEEKVDQVRAQFDNNGGSTMRDRVDRISEKVGAEPPPGT